MTLRRTLLWSLDDLRVVVCEFLNPAVSRSGLDRCLRRHAVSKLRDLIPTVEGGSKPKKSFKDYPIPVFLYGSVDETPHRFIAESGGWPSLPETPNN